MAQQIINNGESGLSVRTKINANFTELFDRNVVVAPTGGPDDGGAINAALATPGTAVRLVAGDYNIITPVVLNNGSGLFGDGDGATRLISGLDASMVTAAAGGIYRPIIRDIQFRNNTPVTSVAGPTFTCNTTAGNSIVTSVSSTVGLYKGIAVSGPGIPPGTFIRYIAGNTIRLGNAAGVYVNATTTASGVSLSTTLRRGPTKHHIYLNNAGWARIQDCYFFNLLNDSDYHPDNAGGIWFDRDTLSQFFINEVHNNWIDRGEIRMGTSDSNIDNNHVWGIGMDAAIRLNAPGIGCRGNNASNGQIAAIIVEATAKESFGSLNHNIVGNNIDSGSRWQDGYGLLMRRPNNVAVAGNRINICAKGGIYMEDAFGVAITGNQFNNNNLDGLSFADVQNVGVTFPPTNVTVTGNTFAQDSAKTPDLGWAIREVNGGASPSGCVYANNTIGASANYLSPAISIARPLGDAERSTVSNNRGGGSESVNRGSFTPALQGSLTPGAPTYVSRTGRVALADRRASVDIEITTSALGGLAGNVSIGGLPLPVAATASRTTFSVGIYGGITLSAGFTQIMAFADPGASAIRLLKVGPGQVPADLTSGELAAGTTISVSGSYEFL